jgi:hypothetical protein
MRRLTVIGCCDVTTISALRDDVPPDVDRVV